ncbi:MAG TPA: 3-phosphoshikimate 1-carboxyvinyltransferase [Candidatus Eremiobacteraceae bacterium]|nr:3-phosphoshikimate 1-carboxyvinyltransferase [Candidatus Eremiobacteraceae bacterium]
MSSIELSAPRPHSATVRMPGDKSISHRAFMCASIADGESSIVGANAGADVRATVDALRALGASIRGDISSAMHVRGIRDFRTPGSALDCGNSGSTMRMLAGLIAGRVDATLDGDASLRRRPMERVTYPLRMMGADVKTTNGKPPLKLRASPQPLRGAAITLPVASAQVKSAVLFAALRAQGPTVVTEPAHTRDHTERMLRSMGASLDVNGNSIAVQPSLLKPLADYRVPGDFSAAFFFIAGAVVLPGSNLRLENLGMNPTRIAALDVLRAMGADIEIMDTREDHGEAIGDVVVRGGRDLRNAAIEAEQIPNLIDEIPALCTLAAAAGIDFEVRNASDLRTKESDRLATTVRLLRAFGAIAEELPDGISIGSGRRLRAPERVTTEGDHRIGMSAAILGLATRSRITIDDTDCIATSFPNFSDVWRSAFY